MSRQPDETDLLEQIAWAIAQSAGRDWRTADPQYRTRVRADARAVLALVRITPAPEEELVSLELSEETYALVMRECALRNLSPGAVIQSVVDDYLAAHPMPTPPSFSADLEELQANARQYNLPSLERRIAALERQVGPPPQSLIGTAVPPSPPAAEAGHS